MYFVKSRHDSSCHDGRVVQRAWYPSHGSSIYSLHFSYLVPLLLLFTFSSVLLASFSRQRHFVFCHIALCYLYLFSCRVRAMYLTPVLIDVCCFSTASVYKLLQPCSSAATNIVVSLCRNADCLDSVVFISVSVYLSLGV